MIKSFQLARVISDFHGISMKTIGFQTKVYEISGSEFPLVSFHCSTSQRLNEWQTYKHGFNTSKSTCKRVNAFTYEVQHIEILAKFLNFSLLHSRGSLIFLRKKQEQYQVACQKTHPERGKT